MPVQRVRRVLRKVDPWTVLKVSLVFNSIVALIFVLGTVVFWSIFVNAGIPEKINELALLVGIENGITLDGPIYFRIVILLAVIGTVAFTGFFTLGSVVYNLISDLVGGIEVIVLEETATPRPTRPRATLPVAKARPKPAKGKGILPNVRPFLRRKEEAPNGEPATPVSPSKPAQPPVRPTEEPAKPAKTGEVTRVTGEATRAPGQPKATGEITRTGT
jgi:hypothetical protein